MPEMMIIMKEGEDGLAAGRESTPGVVTAAEVEREGERKIGRIDITAGGCVVCGESVYQRDSVFDSKLPILFSSRVCTLINANLFHSHELPPSVVQ